MLARMGKSVRMLLSLLSVVVVGVAANAEPPVAADAVPLLMPRSEIPDLDYAARDKYVSTDKPRQSYAPLSRPLLSIGNLDIRLGNGGVGAHFAHYELGTRILGGKVTGTLDGTKGTFRLSWPTGN
jgi:hypothetical protein